MLFANQIWVRSTIIDPRKYGYQNQLYYLMQVHTKAPRRRERWYLDSGYSRHMTQDINNFTTLSRYYEGGIVTFEDDSKGNIIGIANIKVGSSPLIENIVLVDGLKHNLSSISQLCDRGLKLFLMILLAMFQMVKLMLAF